MSDEISRIETEEDVENQGMANTMREEEVHEATKN